MPVNQPTKRGNDMKIQLTDLTTKNFNSRLKTFTSHSKSLRASAQSLIMFGLIHYGKTGDTVYLTKVQKAVGEVKTIPSKTIQKYIVAHANVYLTKIKGIPTYKKRVGAIESEIELPSVEWWNHSVNVENQAVFDIEKYEKAVIKKLEKEEIDLMKFASDLLTIAKKNAAAAA